MKVNGVEKSWKEYLEEHAPKEEMVNHPAHYNKNGGIECIDALRDCLTEEEFIGFCKGNALKYLWRCGAKDEPLQELKKAEWYIKRCIDKLEYAVVDCKNINVVTNHDKDVSANR